MLCVGDRCGERLGSRARPSAPHNDTRADVFRCARNGDGTRRLVAPSHRVCPRYAGQPGSSVASVTRALQCAGVSRSDTSAARPGHATLRRILCGWGEKPSSGGHPPLVLGTCQARTPSEGRVTLRPLPPTPGTCGVSGPAPPGGRSPAVCPAVWARALGAWRPQQCGGACCLRANPFRLYRKGSIRGYPFRGVPTVAPGPTLGEFVNPRWGQQNKTAVPSHQGSDPWSPFAASWL